MLMMLYFFYLTVTWCDSQWIRLGDRSWVTVVFPRVLAISSSSGSYRLVTCLNNNLDKKQQHILTGTDVTVHNKFKYIFNMEG